MIISIEVVFSKNHQKNNSSRKVEDSNEGKFLVFVKSPPKNGRANKEVIRELAKYFQKEVKDIKIVAGLTDSKKKVLIK